MKRRSLIITVILIAIAALVIYVFVVRRAGGTPVWKTVKVERGNVVVTVTATGTVNADTIVQVGAQVSGIISKILVDFDSVVHKGQVIALLDTTLLYAAYLDAQAAVEKAKAQEELQRSIFMRTDTLFSEKVAAQADYDQAHASYRAARSDLQSALANLNHALINLRYATITAPINGIVVSRNVDVGQTVISSFNAPTLFSIANNLKKMQLQANVDEADIGQIKEGQLVDFTVDAYPNEKFTGRVGQIRLQPVTIQNVVNYIVVIDVANKDLKLLPGLTANITVNIQQHENVLKAVSNAVHFQPSAAYMEEIKLPDTLLAQIKASTVAANEIPAPSASCFVWVRRGDSIYPVKMNVGLFDGNYIELSGPVKEGDELVTGMENAQKTSTVKNPFVPQMRPRRG